MNVLSTTSRFMHYEFPEGIKLIHNPYKRKLTEQEAADFLMKYQPVGIIAGLEPLTRRVFESSPGLKIVSRCGIGLDSVDLEAAAELGIRVYNTPDAPTQAVAEHTVMLILALARKLMLLDRNTKNGHWESPEGMQLSGKTAGIVGCGRIGSRVAKILYAFECRLIGCDPLVSTHKYCRIVPFDELLAVSDIVTLHIPLTVNNRHIIGNSQLSMMKKSSLLINTARGGLVDEQALYRALSSFTIAGAAIDCFEAEPYEGPLRKLENTVLTPHMGSSTVESRNQMESEAVKNLLNGLDELGIIHFQG